MATATEKALNSWEYPKKSGIRFQEVLNVHRGEVFGASYLVTVPAKLTGRLRQRKQFKTRATAEEWAEKVFQGHRKEGQGFFRISDEERREVAASLPLLREHSISLGEAVRFAAKHLRAEQGTKSVQDLVNELLASKSQRFERGDLRERSYEDFEQRVRRFAEAFEGRIASEVSANEIKKWIAGMNLGVRSNKNYLMIVGEVFKLGVQRRYVPFNPLQELTDIDRKELCGGTSEAKEPSILTPAEAERLLLAAVAYPELEMLAPVTLALFCGLRTQEIGRLDWQQVRLTEEPAVVTIGAKIAKKRRIRHVELPANALAWLSLVADRTGSVAKTVSRLEYSRRFGKLTKAAGFKKWEQNAMRHSFGSYHYASHCNPLETARLLGHKASDQVLFDHYRALATKRDAGAYFAIRPTPAAERVVRFG